MSLVSPASQPTGQDRWRWFLIPSTDNHPPPSRWCGWCFSAQRRGKRFSSVVFPNLAACQGGRDWPLHHPSTQTNLGFFMTHEANRTWAWTCLETWTHSRPPHYPWNSTTNPRGQECLPQPRALPSLAHQTTERRTAIGPPRPQPWAMAILETWQKEVDVAAVQKLGSSALRRVWVAIQCAIVRHTLRFLASCGVRMAHIICHIDQSRTLGRGSKSLRTAGHLWNIVKQGGSYTSSLVILEDAAPFFDVSIRMAQLGWSLKSMNYPV